jgi:hypothetical protein
MAHRPERRVLRFLAAAAVVLGLLLLLLPHSPASFHTDLAASFVLLPVLLFVLVETADSAFPASADAFVYHSPVRAALFQRPPPLALVWLSP